MLRLFILLALRHQSRTAAVNELKNGSPAECEAAYETALWMLYTLLDESVSGPTGFGSGDFDGGEDLRMDEENRAIIEKCESFCFLGTSIQAKTYWLSLY